jgi:hypothetical protein
LYLENYANYGDKNKKNMHYYLRHVRTNMVSLKDFAIERKDGKGTGAGHANPSSNYPPNLLSRVFITQSNGKSSKPNSHNTSMYSLSTLCL